MNRITVVLLVSLVLAAGCEQESDPFAENIRVLKQEKSQLQNQIELIENENAQLKKQNHALAGLGEKVLASKIYDLQRIRITRFTNFYDKDGDEKLDKLIVYIQPVDEQGDVIKAAGNVGVQLWDLNKEGYQALLGQWQVGEDELKEQWFSTMMKTNYRLAFDVSNMIEQFDEPLTVKVTFTDYLSGKVFKEQKVIKPNLGL